jgi:hypothetical protein
MTSLFPDFTEPNEPDLKPVLELHRGHDGFVSFHRKSESGGWQDLFSVAARELDGVFPQMSPMLEEDSYFSIHGFYRSGYGISQSSPGTTRLKRAFRRSDGLKWLTCCFADIDCHKLGIQDGDAIGAVINAQDADMIPPASMITRSGRGVWLFWFLVNDADDGLIRAWPEKVQIWSAVQRAIGDRLANIGSDAAARDASRVTRIAGSVNRKAAARVAYWLQANKHGHKYRYTLPKMADLLGVTVSRGIRTIENHSQSLRVSEERRMIGLKGQRGRWVHARDQFLQLWEMRGKFEVGTRNNAVVIWTAILRSLRSETDPAKRKFSEAEVLAEVHRLVQCFPKTPPFTTSDQIAAMRAANQNQFGNLRNQTISDWLNITPEEAAFLKTWKAATRYQADDEPVTDWDSMSQSERRELRRRSIRSIVESFGRVPTSEELVSELSDRGIPTVTATVLADLQAMNIENPRKRRRKRKKRTKNGRKLF